MMIFQTAALCIVIIYLLYWFVLEDNPGSFFLKFTAISIASWIVEETSIRAYHSYQYSPDWNLFLGHVPILVILIWPLVIHSGWELASRLMGKNERHARFVAALIIWIDASLVETISVKAGFWSWNAPGIFGVPLIGIFGWVYFSMLSIFILRLKRVKKGEIAKLIFTLSITVCGTHGLIIATWWLIFRWIIFPVNTVFITAIAWFISVLFIYFIHQKNLGVNMGPKILVMRIPPVVLFYILYLMGSPDVFHTAYALAFTVPYFFLIYKVSKAEEIGKSNTTTLYLK